DDLAAPDHLERLWQRTARHLGDHLVRLVPMRSLLEAPRQEEMDALVAEARRGEDRTQRAQLGGGEAGLLPELACGADLRALVGRVEDAGRQLPHPAARRVPVLADE